MKKIILSLLVLVFIGCVQPKKEMSSTDSTTNKKIVLITMDSLDEHWLAVKKGAEETAQKIGGIELLFRAPAGKTDPNEQTRMVEDAINQQADAILLAPTDGAALSPVAERVKAANIPLVLIDSPLNTESYDTFLSTDNKTAGALAAEQLAKLINNQGKIAIVHAQAASGTAISRGTGFEEKLAEIAPNVKIVSVQYSDGDKARALNIATDIITANNDLVGFYTSNEGSTVGVARAIEELGVKDKVMLVGFDKSQDTIRALENGTLKATMVQNPEIMGSKGVEFAMDLINGDVPPRQTDTGVTVITIDNIDLIK